MVVVACVCSFLPCPHPTRHPPQTSQGTGLSPALISECDYLVYIPHTGAGTASLNVACAAAIVLHRYAVWGGTAAAERAGGKYVVAPRPQRTAPRGKSGMECGGGSASRHAPNESPFDTLSSLPKHTQQACPPCCRTRWRPCARHGRLRRRVTGWRGCRGWRSSEEGEGETHTQAINQTK